MKVMDGLAVLFATLSPEILAQVVDLTSAQEI
jgi:hypothetical protein